jgi:hypothetical protein
MRRSVEGWKQGSPQKERHIAKQSEKSDATIFDPAIREPPADLCVFYQISLPLTIMTHPPTGWPDDIPPLPWTFQVGKRQLVIGSANPDLPGEVDEIVFTMNYEDGFVNREIEMARAKFILDAVNNYYGRAGGGNVLP